jgi:hypothetical protein
MENSSEKAASSFQRFDDIVRSERYFTATLLPAILFHDIHDALRGVRSFVELVEKNATTECNRSGDRGSKGTTEYDFTEYDFKDVEVITEFHIARPKIRRSAAQCRAEL